MLIKYRYSESTYIKNFSYLLSKEYLLTMHITDKPIKVVPMIRQNNLSSIPADYMHQLQV
ncbi:MAG: hypothetical protein P857_207 [Candidatus Xenolissoclinum pacificiensis L6]|uniref:Uncharacterized protein n=1 Tax=Candidatus Xenolissoclinum pacificiensis L6 TaxID=1401685 RepID=W2V1J0_9RICK|nr:MAG: hypothetical protein P857_207 [Candidatus Xenolissoclinum pacificiensis L6]